MVANHRMQAFLTTCFCNPSNQKLFDALVTSDMPNWIITSGCLFQTVWNVLEGLPPEQSIRDYDVFYFDDGNIDWHAEDEWINKINSLCGILSAPVEVRNQARVHLWYEDKFAHPYPPLKTAFEGIDRFLEQVAMVGIYAVDDGTPRLYAPAGLDDVYNRIVRPTYMQDLPDIYDEKARRLSNEWRGVKVLPWSPI